MSTDYLLTPEVRANLPMAQFPDRLARYGIRDAHSADADDHSLCLTDGLKNHLWVYSDPKTGMVQFFTRYYPNRSPGYILQCIATEFGIELYNETTVGDLDEGDELIPSFVPEERPSDEEIAAERANWEAHRDKLDAILLEPIENEERASKTGKE
jgi:hypothetical protein